MLSLSLTQIGMYLIIQHSLTYVKHLFHGNYGYQLREIHYEIDEYAYITVNKFHVTSLSIISCLGQ